MGEQAEKAIAANLQVLHKNLLQCREEITSANLGLDKVGSREKKEGPKEKGPENEPQNLSEAISLLSNLSREVLFEASELQARVNKLF